VTVGVLLFITPTEVLVAVWLPWLHAVNTIGKKQIVSRNTSSLLRFIR
jgi:hypothetical protein